MHDLFRHFQWFLQSRWFLHFRHDKQVHRFRQFRRVAAAALLLVLSVFLLTGHAASSGGVQNQSSAQTQAQVRKTKPDKAAQAQKPKAQGQTKKSKAQVQKPKSQNQAQAQKSKAQNQAQTGKDDQKKLSVQEDGTYTSKEEVALYLHTYRHLPSNYITKKEAEALGWDSSKGNLWKVAPGKSIGGSRFGNYEKQLPDKKGRRYYECDIDYDGKYRNAKRIIYSDDGLIFYTEDHYKSFEPLYE